MKFACLMLAIAAMHGAAAHAQGAEALPERLSGRWAFTPPSGGTTFIDTWSIRFEGDRAAPRVKGFVSWRGRGCGAQDDPVEATWDGREVRFQFVARANVNAQIANATYCGDGKTDVSLQRKTGSRAFEGEAVQNNARVQVSGAP